MSKLQSLMMMIIIVALITLLSPAEAKYTDQTFSCYETVDVLEQLAKDGKLVTTGRVPTVDGEVAIFSLWENDRRDTYAATITYLTQGITCLVAKGTTLPTV